MKRNPVSIRSAAFTLAEVCVTVGIVIAIGAVAYALLMSSTTLLAKNLSINASNTTTRTTLDRIFAEVNQANLVKPPPPFDPESTRFPCYLVNADGTASTAGTGPAAGILIDRYVGGPYIVGNPGSGLAATATTFKIYYSLDGLTTPAPDPASLAPAKNDVVVMDGVTRALVQSSSAPSSSFSSPIPNPAPNPGYAVTVTLQAQLGTFTNPPVSSGTAIPWLPTTQQTAYVLHRKAFVVVPANGIDGPPAELRMYPDAENLPSVINDSTKYVVLTREIGTKTYNGVAEHTPFSIVAQNGANFLSVALRVEDRQFNQRLATLQKNELNTFLRVDTLLRPRNNP